MRFVMLGTIIILIIINCNIKLQPLLFLRYVAIVSKMEKGEYFYNMYNFENLEICMTLGACLVCHELHTHCTLQTWRMPSGAHRLLCFCHIKGISTARLGRIKIEDFHIRLSLNC